MKPCFTHYNLRFRTVFAQAIYELGEVRLAYVIHERIFICPNQIRDAWRWLVELMKDGSLT